MLRREFGTKRAAENSIVRSLTMYTPRQIFE
jgi:hypothetical protein